MLANDSMAPLFAGETVLVEKFNEWVDVTPSGICASVRGQVSLDRIQVTIPEHHDIEQCAALVR
jgi:hypothetical protein